MSAITDNRIRIVAALVCDHLGRVLLVRKRGTQAFMQPGGKLEVSESHLVALQRELNEELNCSIEPASTRFLGTFTAPAANEKGYFVEAVVYSVNLTGRAHCGAEIDEIVWPSRATARGGTRASNEGQHPAPGDAALHCETLAIEGRL